jgi:hypothetical protein
MTTDFAPHNDPERQLNAAQAGRTREVGMDFAAHDVAQINSRGNQAH